MAVCRMLSSVGLISLSLLIVVVVCAPPAEESENSVSLNGGGCQCVGYTCGCCEDITLPRIKLNDSVCVNLTYLPDSWGISFTVTVGKHTVFNETISARDPPPVCFGVPYLERYAKFCIRFYDIDIKLNKFHGCVDLEAYIEHIQLGKYDLGCFNMGNFSFPLNHEDNSIRVILV